MIRIPIDWGENVTLPIFFKPGLNVKIMKVLSIQSRREMTQAYNSLCEGAKSPEVHMHGDDYELYDEWCRESEVYRGIPYFKGQPVKMGERFKAVKGNVIFARGALCANASISFVEEADYLEEINCISISRDIQEAFDNFTPERRRRFIALLEKKAEDLRKTLLNQV